MGLAGSRMMAAMRLELTDDQATFAAEARAFAEAEVAPQGGPGGCAAAPRRAYLEPGTRVYQEDIETWEQQTGVSVEAGDILLIRTGRWARREALQEETGTAGLDASFLPFLAERDVALLGGDTAHEVRDNIPGFDVTVVHKFTIVARGMNLFDNLDLEEVAETAARLQRWEFLFIASPVRVPKGTGSPINPIAVF